MRETPVAVLLRCGRWIARRSLPSQCAPHPKSYVPFVYKGYLPHETPRGREERPSRSGEHQHVHCEIVELLLVV